MTQHQEETANGASVDNVVMEQEYEQLLLTVLRDISEAMKRNEISRADLARRLGSSRAHVTQTFAGTRKLTLRLLSNMAWASGVRMTVKFQPLKTRT